MVSEHVKPIVRVHLNHLKSSNSSNGFGQAIYTAGEEKPASCMKPYQLKHELPKYKSMYK